MRASHLLVAAAAGCLGATAVLAADEAPKPADPPKVAVPMVPPTPRALTEGVWLIPGGIVPNRQPDGNTVVFETRSGLVVMDTGRHKSHRQAILDFAKAHHKPIVAIVNSHWHLDHVSGNPDIKRAYPKARVYASGAIDGALTGFFPDSAKDGRKYLDAGLDPATREDLVNDLATIDAGRALKPDVVITKSRTLEVGGRKLQIRLAPNAATDGDVWVYDPASKIAAVGDLVTLPAPFLDTACVKGWRAALDQVWDTPFQTAIPGHGPVMSRADFDLYRKAFDAFADCAASTRDTLACAGDWATGVKPLLGTEDLAFRQAKGMSAYYVSDVLRAHGGDSAWCHAGKPAA